MAIQQEVLHAAVQPATQLARYLLYIPRSSNQRVPAPRFERSPHPSSKCSGPKRQVTKLLHLFWNNIGDEELVKHFGDGTDKFIGPSKFIREGVFEIENNEDFEGLEYKATITLRRLVPKKAEPALVQSTKGKKAA